MLLLPKTCQILWSTKSKRGHWIMFPLETALKVQKNGLFWSQIWGTIVLEHRFISSQILPKQKYQLNNKYVSIWTIGVIFSQTTTPCSDVVTVPWSFIQTVHNMWCRNLLYPMNMFYSCWLIKKLLWYMEGQNTARLEET